MGNRAREDIEMVDEDGNARARKTCEVVNPGNFSHDLSFVAIYPNNSDEPVQLSKVPQ